MRKFTLTIAFVAAICVFCGLLYAAGTTVNHSPLSLSGLTFSNYPGGVEVYCNKGLRDIRTITVQLRSNVSDQVAVKPQKTQSMSVGSLTDLVEQTWYFLVQTSTFTFAYCDRFSLKTTNNAQAFVDIWFNEMTTLDAQTNAVETDMIAWGNAATNGLGNAMQAAMDVKTNSALNVAQAFSDVKTNGLGNAMQAAMDVKTNGFYTTYFSVVCAASNTSRGAASFCTNSADNMLNVTYSQPVMFMVTLTNLDWHIDSFDNCLSFLATGSTNQFMVWPNPSTANKTVKIALHNTSTDIAATGSYLHMFIYGAAGLKAYDVLVVTNSQSGL